jgi:hypothetical protein
MMLMMPAIDEDGDAVATTQRDHAVLIHGHAGQVSHRVEQRPGGLGRPVVQAVDLRVDARRPSDFGRNGDLFLECVQVLQADVAEVEYLIQLPDEQIDFDRIEAREGRADGVVGWW